MWIEEAFKEIIKTMKEYNNLLADLGQINRKILTLVQKDEERIKKLEEMVSALEAKVKPKIGRTRRAPNPSSNHQRKP